MDNKENTDNTEPYYMKMDKDLSNRVKIYLTECKILKNPKITNQKQLTEEALHEYMLNHPNRDNAI